MFDTYRALVESRMLYGVEVCGSIVTETVIERMRAKLAKLILNVPLCTANDAARCELGWTCGLEVILVRVLKYYNYIMSKGEDAIVKICFQYYLRESEKDDNKEHKLMVNKVKRHLACV